MAEFYRSALTQADLIANASTNTVAGQFVKLGERKIYAGEQIALGFAESAGQDNAVGRLFIDLQNATVAVEGTVRISIFSPQNRPLVTLHEFRTETLRHGAADRSLQVPFPVGSAWSSEDKKLVLEFMADTTGIVDRNRSKILMDVTVEAM